MAEPKVLQLVTSFLRFKGDYSFNYEFMSRLVKKGVGIDVVVPHNRENSLGFEEVDGIRIHRFQYFFPKQWQRIAYHGGVAFNLANSLVAKIQFPFFMLSFFLKALGNSRGKNIIHAQWIPSGLVGIILKKLTGKPVVLWVHRMVFGNFIQTALTKFVLRNCDFVMFNSSYTLEKAKAVVKLKDFGIVSPSIDEKKFKVMTRVGLRKKIGVENNKKIIFSIGRFVEKKGFVYLIEAMHYVKSDGAVCVIAGHGPLEKELKQMVKGKGLSDKIIFIGEVQNADVPLWMNEADIVVIPSIVDSRGETETLGIVALEATACGKPVIVSKVGGLIDVVKDGFNGFLVKPKNPKEIAKKLNILLKDEILRKRMSKNARDYTEKNFSWYSAVEKGFEIYQKILRLQKS